MLTLYGHPDSGHAYKIALALTLEQIPYSYEWIDIWAPCETRPKTFRENSRWCEVPLLLTETQALTQSGAILQYLARERGALGGMSQFQEASEWVIWEANRIGMCLPQLIQAKKTPDDYPQGAVDWLEGRLAIDRNRLSTALENRAFLCGSEPRIADIAIFGYVSMAIEYDIPMTPEILAWAERIRQLPYFQSRQILLASRED